VALSNIIASPTRRKAPKHRDDASGKMHGYKEPLRLEEIPVPDFGPDEVLVKAAAAGMCHSDFQLVDGYFHEGPSVFSHDIGT
jgi:D-arabinose 1-dehydrogenase-like Zn-dependent alcohol dehydrogenase